MPCRSLADEDTPSSRAAIGGRGVSIGKEDARRSETFDVWSLIIVALRSSVVGHDLERTAYPALVVREYDDEVG